MNLIDIKQATIDNIKDCAKSTNAYFLTYLLLIIYCSLVIISKDDINFVFKESVSLPVINIDLPVNFFFLFAPLLIIVVFFYFQLNLKETLVRTNEASDENPGIGLNQIHSWIIVKALKELQLNKEIDGLINRFVIYIMLFILWWSLPLIMTLFVIFYLKFHDYSFTYFIIFLPLIAAILSFSFYYASFKGRTDKIEKTFINLMLVIFPILTLILLCYLVPLSLSGSGGIKMNLSKKILVGKIESDLDYRYSSNYQGVHLEGADLSLAVLTNADLSNTFLQFVNANGSKFDKTDLTNSNLSHSSCNNASFNFAILDRCNLGYGNFVGSYFYRASFINTNFNNTDLREAKLINSNLNSSFIDSSTFIRTKLDSSNLSYIQITNSIFQEASLQKINLSNSNIKISDFSGSRLENSNFSLSKFEDVSFVNTNLTGVDFTNATLINVNFEGATMKNAILAGTIFKDVKNLTTDQVLEARSLSRTQFDESIFNNLISKNPKFYKIIDSTHRIISKQ